MLAPHELENLPLFPYAGPTLSLKREKDSKVIVKLLAKRFAAKEAIVKALGTGFQEGIWLTNLEISHNALGKPIVVYHDAALDFITKLGVCGTEISISDEKDFAVAFVIVLKRV
ncbi:MAG: holo-[acyl-carrier-protein] synthase [Legionellales bacterium]|nr:MAG: holo-[acyl-carrier-protein] synthase [Legionellales bacterium]